MYEKMTGKAFGNLVEEEEIKKFMYCVFVCSTDIKISYPVFLDMLESKKFSRQIESEFKRIMEYTYQFSSNEKIEKHSSVDTDEQDLSMTDYVNTLIVEYCVDADYVMNKMDIWELEGMYNAATSKVQNTMVDKRLWAYIQMLPNLDKKNKNMTPEKFLPFPWEKENIKKKQEKELEKETKVAKSLIGMDLNTLLGKKEEICQAENLQ